MQDRTKHLLEIAVQNLKAAGVLLDIISEDTTIFKDDRLSCSRDADQFRDLAMGLEQWLHRETIIGPHGG